MSLSSWGKNSRVQSPSLQLAACLCPTYKSGAMPPLGVHSSREPFVPPAPLDKPPMTLTHDLPWPQVLTRTTEGIKASGFILLEDRGWSSRKQEWPL